MPKLSIVMPVKDGEKYLAQSILSFKEQTFNDWELVIVDDHSQDSTRNIAEKEQTKDKRIKYYPLTEGRRIAAGRHFGNTKATGEIIVVADVDDVNFPNRLEEVNNAFEKTSTADVFYANCRLFYVSENKKILRWFQPYNKELLEQINYVPNPVAAYKRESYFKLTKGYDQSIFIGEDYDLWLQFAYSGANYIYLEKPLIEQSIHATSTRGKFPEEQKRDLEKIRAKYNIKPDINLVKKLARPEVYEYFTQPTKKSLWFN